MSEVEQKSVKNLYKSRLKLGFGLFFIFFAFYIWVAIINTPSFKDFAGIPVLGMPLGMLLSLRIFPFSFILVIIYFLKWR